MANGVLFCTFQAKLSFQLIFLTSTLRHVSIKFVTFKDIRNVHIESTVHIRYKYLIITFNSHYQKSFRCKTISSVLSSYNFIIVQSLVSLQTLTLMQPNSCHFWYHMLSILIRWKYSS